jgi:phosphoribosylaminoimidazole (AIR) synthetase
VFVEIQRRGAVDDAEMARVFNLGIGMVLVVAPDDVARTRAVLEDSGYAAAEIGHLVADGTRQVRFA